MSHPSVVDDPRFRDLLDTLGEGVTVADRSGRIVFSNKAADRILGMTASAVAPEEWAEHYGVFLPDSQVPFPTDRYPLVRAINGEETEDVEMLVRNPNVPDGVLISVTGRPMKTSPEGEIVGATVVFRDVTRLRDTERQLKRALESRDELSAFIVHDLKSPLTTIMTLVELLQASQSLDGHDLEMVHEIRNSARSMQRMVMDLLDLHVAETGHLTPAREPVRVSDLLEEVEIRCGGPVMAHGQQLNVQHASADLRVLADRDLMDRVLFNLVDNCVKYGQRGGSIGVSATEAGGRVRFEVSDQGPGVPDELKEEIFEKFTRVERPARGPHRHGHGVGLSFSKAVVDAQGGRIWVEDNPPRGARFCVELPEG